LVGYTASGPWLISTVNSRNGANMLMIPAGMVDIVQFIHHGVATSMHLGGMEILLFMHGNISEVPPKVLNVAVAVRPIYPPNLV
jgi:hypothetical protein